MTNNDLKSFLNSNKDKFGLSENVPTKTYLDICAKNVKCMTTIDVKEIIPLPSINSIMNNCSGILDFPSEIDTSFAHFRVTNATEYLVDCHTDNPGVRILIEGQIVVRTMPIQGCPSYIAIPITVVDTVLYDFYSTKDGSLVCNLKELLNYIEGSCMVVQLKCKIKKEVLPTYTRYVAIIKGCVTDKLWRNDNIWIEGFCSYSDNSLIYCDTFLDDTNVIMQDSLLNSSADITVKSDDAKTHHHKTFTQLVVEEKDKT